MTITVGSTVGYFTSYKLASGLWSKRTIWGVVEIPTNFFPDDATKNKWVYLRLIHEDHTVSVPVSLVHTVISPIKSPHVFVTKEGKEYTFDTEAEMYDFGITYAIGNLVAEGKGTIEDVDGKPAFKINEIGLAELRQLTGETLQ